MQFPGFAGNRAELARLAASFDSGRLPHALLIEGPRGSGRKTLAGIIAAALVCRAETGKRPCGVCPPCQKAFSGNHPDIRFVSGGTGPRSFPVAEVRRVREEAFVAPNEADGRVTVLTDIQNMSEQAQNALLKIIEEPPRGAVFILTCDDRAKVLETVRSRCRLVTLGPVSGEEAAGALVRQGADPEKAARAVELSGGVIGRAKEALEGGGLEKAAAFMDEFSAALCGGNDYAFLRLSGKLEKDAAAAAVFLPLLPLLLRDAVNLRLSGGEGISGCSGAAAKLSTSIPLAKLCAMLGDALEACGAAERYVNKTLLFTWLFGRMRAAKKTEYHAVPLD